MLAEAWVASQILFFRALTNILHTMGAEPHTLMPSGWVYVVHTLIGGIYVWIEFSDSVFSFNHRAYGDLFPQRLYPQDERDDPPSGRNRGQHTQIKRP